MRALRLLMLLLVGLASLPVCAAPCHAPAARVAHEIGHGAGHHRPAERPVHVAAACLGCCVALPVPVLPAPPRRIAIAYARLVPPALAGREPVATAPPPRA